MNKNWDGEEPLEVGMMVKEGEVVAIGGIHQIDKYEQAVDDGSPTDIIDLDE